jgi:hypothetical protein
MPGSMVVQFMSATWFQVLSTRGPASARVRAKTMVRIIEAMMPLGGGLVGSRMGKGKGKGGRTRCR